MIISRTPYRISLFGGGSDFPEYYREHGGRVLSFAINKYCYISVRKLPPFFAHHDRVVYSKVENTISYSEIQHPAVRAVLEYLHPPYGVSITHDGDIPARSGIGSSSAFTVGLLNALQALERSRSEKRQLAETAIYIEQEKIGETVGSQDQICSAYGGFNAIEFYRDEPFRVIPLDLPGRRQQEFLSHLALFFTGISRISSDVAKEQKQNIPRNATRLKELSCMAKTAVKILRSASDITEIGYLLHESWKIKKQLSSKVTSSQLDGIYEKGLNNGALGGKLLGAGAGGFMLFFVTPENRERLKAALSDYLYVPFDIDMNGSQIIFNDYGDMECRMTLSR